MKLKLDENLPADRVDLLALRGHDVDTAPAESLAGHDDIAVFNAALHEHRILMTQALDSCGSTRWPGRAASA